LSAEAIIGALVPVFVLEYAGLDPKILTQIDITKLSPPGTVNLDPLAPLAALGGPPLYKVALLSSLPLLVNGISSYLLVPLSIAIGRRPVLLFAGVLAWTGGFWAGFSTSLDSHLAARCFQGLGAGAVEALIPLIVQDFMFIHKRNKAIASIGASQGLIIVSLGIARFVLYLSIPWPWPKKRAVTNTGQSNHCGSIQLAVSVLPHIRSWSPGLAAPHLPRPGDEVDQICRRTRFVSPVPFGILHPFFPVAPGSC
jgi:MFS family permease